MLQLINVFYKISNIRHKDFLPLFVTLRGLPPCNIKRGDWTALVKDKSP